MNSWPAPIRYGLAIAAAHGAFRAMAELGYLATDARGRIRRGPKLA